MSSNNKSVDQTGYVWFTQSLSKTPVDGHDDMDWAEEVELPTAMVTVIKFKEPKTWQQVRALAPKAYVRVFKIPGFDDEQTVSAGAEVVADTLKCLSRDREWVLRIANVQLTKLDPQVALKEGTAGKKTLPRRK